MTKNTLSNPQISKERIKKIWITAFAKNSQERKIPLRGYVFASLGTNLFVIILVFSLVYTKRIPPEVPLFYGAPEGEEQLASDWMLTLPAFVAIGFTAISTLVSYFLREDFLKKSLIVGAFTVTVLSTITTLKIVGLISGL